MTASLSVILPLSLAYVLTLFLILYSIVDELQDPIETSGDEDEEVFWAIASLPICYGMIPPFIHRIEKGEKGSPERSCK
jgi:hypothetical protein